MKLENQVCTFKQSKKLNSLGVIQGISQFYFDSIISDKQPLFNQYPYPGTDFYDAKSCFSAFTVAELGILLGRGITAHTPKVGDNEAILRADDLIYLLKIGELTPETCNERLKNS